MSNTKRRGEERQKHEVQYILLRGSSVRHSPAMPTRPRSPSAMPGWKSVRGSGDRREAVRRAEGSSRASSGSASASSGGTSLLRLGAVYSLVLILKAKLLPLLWGKCHWRPLHPGEQCSCWMGACGQRCLSRAEQSAPLSLEPRSQSVQFAILWDGQVSLPREFAVSAHPPLRS